MIPKNDNKTIVSLGSVQEFLDNYPNQKVITDCQKLIKLFEGVTGEKAQLWSTMIGFGSYHYKYESGREGDYFITGFAPSKIGITIYTNCQELIASDDTFLKDLGKHKSSKACLYIKQLSDINQAVLKKIIKKVVNISKQNMPNPTSLNQEVLSYNDAQSDSDKAICIKLAELILVNLPNSTNKVWHRHPVWFLDGNPIVGYSKLKNRVQLLFWSGQSFDEAILKAEGSFKAAQISFTDLSQISEQDITRLLNKSITIQWDYKNIVKRKGKLEKLNFK
jgi:Domain of unknown function (DU1801)